MNNYSAEAPIQDTLAFLDEIINKANYYVSNKIKDHEALFNEAKEHVKEFAADDDILSLRIREDIVYTWSKFEQWKNAGIWHQLWNDQPADDTEEHRKQCERKALEDAREIIITTLDDMYDLQRFYETATSSARLNFTTPSYYPIGYSLTMKLSAAHLTHDLRAEYVDLKTYNKKIRKLQQMCDSLAVYEFETVIIEENMLEIIEAVKKNIV